MSPSTARLTCASPQFVERATPPELDDWLAYFDPDLVVLTGDAPAPRAASALGRRTDGDTPVVAPAGNAPAAGPRTIAGVQFVLAPTTRALEAVADHERGTLDPDDPTYLLGGLLELDVDTTALSTSLVGREAYAAALDPGRLDGEYVHLSTRLPAEYRREWDDLAVVGAGREAGRADEPMVALDCRSDGRVLTRTLRRTALGLRALDGVGETRARRLREAGFADRGTVADASPGALPDLPGIGEAAAERIRRSARAIARREVVRASDAPVPGGDPVYVDIETDGLNPTVTWLIGVLDAAGGGYEYRSFLGTDPDDPGGAIEAFLTWYDAEASDRTLVAYRGREFDFSVLREHVAEYRPEYLDVWRAADRFDPYRWAVERGNAALPGRTNRLADVAGALGSERSGPDLTGAAVARAYRRWTADPSPATELDWERFEAYCEDDVRGLAAVHEALAASGRIVSADEPSRDVGETTTQGTLSDW